MAIGKAIAGGVPIGAYGMTDEVAARVLEATDWDAADVGGVGGTLAGNALSPAAARATLDEVLTEEAFERMIGLGERFAAGCDKVIEEFDLPWQATRLGCRVEYMFAKTPPKARWRGGRRVRHPARRPPPPLHAEPRHPDDPVST